MIVCLLTWSSFNQCHFSVLIDVSLLNDSLWVLFFDSTHDLWDIKKFESPEDSKYLDEKEQIMASIFKFYPLKRNKGNKIILEWSVEVFYGNISAALFLPDSNYLLPRHLEELKYHVRKKDWFWHYYKRITIFLNVLLKMVNVFVSCHVNVNIGWE